MPTGRGFPGGSHANPSLRMPQALAYLAPAAAHNDDLAKTFEGAQARFCVMSFTTDWRFSPERSREIVDALLAARKDVCYLEIDAPQGHGRDVDSEGYVYLGQDTVRKYDPNTGQVVAELARTPEREGGGRVGLPPPATPVPGQGTVGAVYRFLPPPARPGLGLSRSWP